MRGATVEKIGYSENEASLAIGVSRHFLRKARRLHEIDPKNPRGLAASQFGTRRVLILKSELERWCRAYAIRPTADAEHLVARRLEHEASEFSP